MRRPLAILVFATAAAAATAAGSGVVVAAHVDPPGTPHFHTHGLALYRLPIFVTFARPHETLAGLGSEESLFDLASTFVLALLTLVAPRLPRPMLDACSEIAAPAIARAQWAARHSHGPPRAALPA